MSRALAIIAALLVGTLGLTCTAGAGATSSGEMELLAPRYPHVVEQDAVRLPVPAGGWTRLDPAGLHEHAVLALSDASCPGQMTVYAQEALSAIPRAQHTRAAAVILTSMIAKARRRYHIAVLADRNDPLAATPAAGTAPSTRGLPGRLLEFRGSRDRVETAEVLGLVSYRPRRHRLMLMDIVVEVYSVSHTPSCRRQVAAVSRPAVLAMLTHPVLVLHGRSTG